MVEVTGLYADTWRFLLKQKASMNGAELARRMRINPTAMNNRLVWLEAHGLAISTRNGKECLWVATAGE